MTTAEVATLGEVLVGLVAQEGGPLADVAVFRRHVVGAESNVAIGLARLGRSVAFVGRVGADGFGLAALRRMRAEGVDVTFVQTDANAPTGLLVRENRRLGHSQVIYHRRGSAGSRLGPADVAAAAGVLRNSRWIHLSGITPGLSNSAREAVEAAIALGIEAKVTISFDVNLRRRLWSDTEATRVLAPLARQASIILGDAAELNLIAGTTDPRAAVDVLLGAGVKLVVEKRGAAGARAFDGTALVAEVPAIALPAVVDPVGAGDAFCAGLIAARLESRDLFEALRWGIGCAAAALSTEGDIEGLPNRAELDRLLVDAAVDTIR